MSWKTGVIDTYGHDEIPIPELGGHDGEQRGTEGALERLNQIRKREKSVKKRKAKKVEHTRQRSDEVERHDQRP
jgi:hypothetical protein